MANTTALLFVIAAFVIQLVLIVHFALRRWAFAIAMRFGVFVYALCLPALVVSLVLWLDGQPWYLWMAGLLYTVWALFGYVVEYRRHLNWRTPIRWPIFIPYVILYVASIMFYWWPLATISRPLWYVYAGLFVISTLLNVSSHAGPTATSPTSDESQLHPTPQHMPTGH